jgi:cyanophycinase
MVRKKMAELTGKGARLVIIPTADPSLEPTRSSLAEYSKQATALFSAVGFGDIAVLHTRERKRAESDEFVLPLRAANAVWIPGGASDLLEKTYGNTKVLSELRALLSRGGIVAGDSAGAYVLAQFGVSRQRSTMQIGMTEGGLNLLPNIFVLVHANVMREVTKNISDIGAFASGHPELLGISIDENTAIVIRGGRITEVVGSGSVSLVDGRKDKNGIWVPLSPSQQYDLNTRAPI